MPLSMSKAARVLLRSTGRSEQRIRTSGACRGARAGRGGGPTSQVNPSSESEAGGLDQVFTNYLGRTATDEEVQEWQKVLNQAQMANPTRNTGGTNSVTSGGFDTICLRVSTRTRRVVTWNGSLR